MTTTQDIPTQLLTPYVAQANPEPVTLRRVMGSDWAKLRSLRSSWITMALAVAGMAVVAVAAAA